jgi:hypothetical protein
MDPDAGSAQGREERETLEMIHVQVSEQQVDGRHVIRELLP